MFFFRQPILNRLIFLFPFFVLCLLLFLSIFCHPTAEDIAIYYYNNTKGLNAYIRDFYFNASSRYFSFPLLFILLNGDFILNHYYLVPITLILLLWFSIYYLLSVIAIYTISNKACKSFIAWLATLILLTLYSVAFEPSSIFYWISGSVTYLPSYILFLLLAAQMLKLFNKNRATVLSVISCISCTVLICGSNEISLCFLFVLLISCQFVYYRLNKRLNHIFNVLILILILCVLFLIIPAGSGKRSHNFSATFSFSNAGLSAVLYTVRTIYRVISMPFVWITIVIGWIVGHHVEVEVKKVIIRSGITPLNALFFCTGVALFFYFGINFLSGELLPPRANNLMTFYILVFVLLAALLAGVRYVGSVFLWENKKISAFAGTGLLIIFFTSQLFANSIENVFSGYIYNKIMNERELAISTALQSGKNSVELFSYDVDYKKQLEQIGSFTKKYIEKIDKYPRLIYYLDPVADTSFYIHYYAAYKKIDSIQFQGKRFGRLMVSVEKK